MPRNRLNDTHGALDTSLHQSSTEAHILEGEVISVGKADVLIGGLRVYKSMVRDAVMALPPSFFLLRSNRQ